ncbi:hypothetical protein GIY23_00665 [Allosaccharopolyspora coralli]|uniref:Peptidoglycan recognition protein family domain-containing protein n=1 Tax=Allosaccharopolyspora coralli TaxID=2665642 RepID=A0A5Q3QBV4_9PSEU|nr:N-acetylmuramoyl-L-alanine amidase [Allosaccharopolyspora coralli]QGK68277.1 hypothetical protein GIY23_00665 [Allosaccharopolyspora coralli]
MRLFPVIAAIVLTSGPVVAPAAHADEGVETTVDRVALASVATDRSGVREVRPGNAFRMVGLTWRGAAPDSVQLRHRDSGAWSPWTSLDPATGGPGATGTEPLWVGHATEVRVRATENGRDVTDRLTLVALDPGSADTPTPTAKGGHPPVVTRAQWGADESKMTWPPEPTPTTKAVAVHHTAGANDYSCQDSAALVRGIFEYHAVELGWGDIGYHVLVDRCGTMFEGRTGGLTGHVVGGHAGGFNRDTFGVSMMGSHDLVEPGAAALESVSSITAWKLAESGVDPRATATLVSAGGGTSRYPEGAEVALPTVFAHRDVGNTDCPGRYGYAAMDRIRDRAAELIPPPAP